MRLHLHHDPDWKIDGVHAYHRCRRCGARRVRLAYSNLAGPTRPGWPELVDRHGRPLVDTGWVK